MFFKVGWVTRLRLHESGSDLIYDMCGHPKQ